ncbi:MAG: hypothetical protein IKT95_01100 [Spirochaetales bacterium]|nr:hypothetical protein [Spirochaetales bacterium]
MKRIALALSALILALFLASCSQDTVPESTYWLMYSHLSEVWAQSLEHADAEIAFFGDSRVIGADWYSAYPDKKVINLGVGGDKISNLLLRMNQIKVLAEKGNLKYCFLAIGGNDCLSSKFNTDTFRSEYDTLLTKLQELGITVYVNTIAGVTSEGTSLSEKDAGKANSKMAQGNEIIRDLAQLHGMILIDMAELMNNTDGTLKAAYASPDGVHFSADGNAFWYDTLRPYLYD